MHRDQERPASECWKKRRLPIDRAAHDRSQNKSEDGIERRRGSHEPFMAELDDQHGKEIGDEGSNDDLPDGKALRIRAENIFEHTWRYANCVPMSFANEE